LRRADHSSKESYCLSNDHETENQRPEANGAVEPVKKKKQAWAVLINRYERNMTSGFKIRIATTFREPRVAHIDLPTKLLADQIFLYGLNEL
jgi:predicted protein tyrosine phosphatase